MAKAKPQWNQKDLLQVLLQMLTAVAISVSAYATFQNYNRLSELAITVRDTDDLRRGLRKPLEGVWKYSMKYDRFWDEDGNWEATGKAVFIWQPSKRRYEIMIGASLITIDGGSIDGAQTGQLVTWLFQSDLKGDAAGWPTEPFTLECEYRGRTVGEGGRKTSGEAYARFKEIEIVGRNEREAFKLRGLYETESGSSRGELTLTRVD